MRHIKLYEDFHEQSEYYTTSAPMDIDQFKETEVEERGNYTKGQVNKWVKTYGVTKDSSLLWVSTKPHIAARYQMDAGDWDNCEKIYNADKDKYDVRTVPANDGIVIPGSDDGDDGYVMILSKEAADKWEH
jgi:hypothetical protein